MYLIPIILNFIAIISCKKPYKKREILGTSIISTLFYCIYSYSLMSTSVFNAFIDKYKHNDGNFFVEIEPNFIGMPQIIFVFLIHFTILYVLCRLFLERSDINVRN